jgi:hypothetical protein
MVFERLVQGVFCLSFGVTSSLVLALQARALLSACGCSSALPASWLLRKEKNARVKRETGC